MKTHNINSFFTLLLGALFPTSCISCGVKTNEDKVLCGNCEVKIEINTSFFCPDCGRRLLEMKNGCHPEARYILGSACSYKNKIVRDLIHALKYERVAKAAEILAKILNLYMEHLTVRYPEFKANDFVIFPMPLHRKKERKRGFNQSSLILKSFNKYTGENNLRLKYSGGILKRKKNTQSQTKCKSKKERIAHMENAFEIISPEKIAGKNVIILDDVFTSGATMNEAVRVVKNAGAKKVIALVIAKT